MKTTLLRTVLRKEVVGLARAIVIILAVFLFLLEFGYRADAATEQLLDRLSYGLVAAAAFVTLGSMLRTLLRNERVRKAEAIWFIAALLLIYVRPAGLRLVDHDYHWPHLVFLLFFMFIELSRLEIGRHSTVFNPALLFAASFVLLISIGAALLMLPNTTTRPISMVDAIFMSTSAVCVTGLTVIDVGQDLTFMGQCVLMLLFQLGGLGVMTFTSFFAFFFKGRTSLEEQLRIRDISQTSLGNARTFIIQVILFTITVEAIGMAFIFTTIPENLYPNLGDRLFFSAFHSISAFNNAGFSTFGAGIEEMPFRFNYPLMWVIALLFIAGGLGFGIIFNFGRYIRLWIVGGFRRLAMGIPMQRHPRIVNLSTRLVLQTTLILLIIGTTAILVFEWNGALAEHQSWWGRITAAFFTGATPRSCGFAVLPAGLLSIPSIMIILLLMYIGGSPGSTAGGIKTTTFAIATLTVFATARGRNRVEYGGREISNLSIRRAFSHIVLSLVFLGLSISIIASLERGQDLLPIAFECFSAYLTVGLSMGSTPELSEPARLILSVVMFVGRVSALNLLVAVLRQVQVTSYRYPKEDILIN